MSKKHQQPDSSIYQSVIDNPKVPMTLRIGIAGPRHLSNKETTQGLAQLKIVLNDISAQLVSFIKTKEIVKKLYDTKSNNKPTLRLTSSLAIGVDRMSMNASSTDTCGDLVDIEHAAILPFLFAQCEQGFYDESQRQTKNAEEFSALSACVAHIKSQNKCRLIELDGDITSPDSRDKAHYRCAEYLIENIDLLIVINKAQHKTRANEVPVQHIAGTASTITLAQEAGRPIIHITLGSTQTKCDMTIGPAKTFGSNDGTSEYSQGALQNVLGNVVLFDSIFKLNQGFADEACSLKQTNHSLDHTKAQNEKIDNITQGLHHHVEDKKYLSTNNGPTDFNFQGNIQTSFTITEKLIGRQGFDMFKRFLTSNKKVASFKNRLKRSDKLSQADNQQSEMPPNIDEAHHWFAYFLRADALAKRFASIHRSTYLLIYFFAASALIIAATSLAYQANSGLVVGLIVCEFLVLLLIYALYMGDHHNHNKWLQNRCLAEAIRPNIYLSQLGRCFSFFNIRSSDEFMYREIMGHNQSGAQWVCIQQELINRHIGFEHCQYTPSNLQQSIRFLNTAWVSGQISYHLTNAAKMQAIGERFSKNTHWLFFLTLLALLVKGVLKFGVFGDVSVNPLQGAVYQLSALLTAVFPILGTALFAIRNHSEFDISAQRSLTMLAFFNSIYSSFNTKTGGNSTAFDVDLSRLTDVSAQEMSDWLEIYEVKESEPG